MANYKRDEEKLVVPITTKVTPDDACRIEKFCKATGTTQARLVREMVLEALDSPAPLKVLEWLEEGIFTLNVHPSGDLWLSSEAADTIYIGSIDTDGDYSSPEHWDYWENEVGKVQAWIAGQLRREITGEDLDTGWYWYDYTTAMHVFAFEGERSDEYIEAVLECHRLEHYARESLFSWEDVDDYASTVSALAAGKSPFGEGEEEEIQFAQWHETATAKGLEGWPAE